VDYHRNTFRTLAARLFRSEHQPKVPANRQLDPRIDRYRRHTHHSEPSSCDINLLDKDDSIESVEAYQASTDSNSKRSAIRSMDWVTRYERKNSCL
jgi:hypothetical protein